MPGSVYDDLEERLADARADYARGAKKDAIAEIDGFLDIVEQHGGTDIPDVWRSARDVHNVAGYLRSGGGDAALQPRKQEPARALIRKRADAGAPDRPLPVQAGASAPPAGRP